ncbi:MAG: acyltransferase family protein [Prevotella sp.]|nr:acyltransferase family protein [Prevotella sp.]
MMNNSRLHYIDVLKGILIIIVVLHHIFGLMRQYEYLPQETDYLEKLYVPFFMAAFFVVTGFCSNYNKDFKSFLRTNAKSLLVPAIIFYYIIHGADLIITQRISIFEIVKMCGKFVLFGGAWFLTSMFFAKLIAYALINNQKLKNIFQSAYLWGGQIFVILLFLMLISSVLCTYKIPEPWSLYHSFGLVIFIILGTYMRNIKIGKYIFIASLIIYIFYAYVLIHYDLHLPRITSKLSIYPYEIPLFVIGAMSGTLVIWYISKIIDRNNVLEYLGRNSLVIYLTHWIIIKGLIVLYQRYVSYVEITTPVMFVSLFAITMIMCVCLVKLFQNKRFSWMIGKF